MIEPGVADHLFIRQRETKGFQLDDATIESTDLTLAWKHQITTQFVSGQRLSPYSENKLCALRIAGAQINHISRISSSRFEKWVLPEFIHTSNLSQFV
ncbi:hypothetical protein EKH79_03590 [Dyella dinghuensis]|uniref:Uncharacterized protein n=1 Tax=Dyella dinghuensis TaxID=1920169 RepID=A0A432LVE0_9GAMM|nr:hypothetical protein [Dyella dinghuensis]RUL65807.1 hypothetical protein EKH79_03590 [Dyella dinghuensis]